MANIGRPTKLTPKLVKKARAYLAECTDSVKWHEDPKTHAKLAVQTVKLPTIEGLAYYLHVHRDTLYDWEKHDRRISDILEDVRQVQADRLLNKGLGGSYNSTIAKMLLSSKHNYIERTAKDIDARVTLPKPILGGISNVPGDDSTPQAPGPQATD